MSKATIYMYDTYSKDMPKSRQTTPHENLVEPHLTTIIIVINLYTLGATSKWSLTASLEPHPHVVQWELNYNKETLN